MRTAPPWLEIRPVSHPAVWHFIELNRKRNIVANKLHVDTIKVKQHDLELSLGNFSVC